MSRLSALGGGLLAALALAVPAHAADFAVTNTDDTGEGSLRLAIVAANSLPGEDVIDATGLSGTIELQSALPLITDPVEIKGPGSGELTLRRAAGDNYRLLAFDLLEADFSEVYVSGLALIGLPGAELGGGIRSWGAELNLDDVVVSGHVAETENGGGLAASGGGRVLLTDSTISDNQGTNGGGVHVEPSTGLDLTNTTVSDNEAGVAGGGIYAPGLASMRVIRNSTIVGNILTDESVTIGGGIAIGGHVLIDASTIAANSADHGANVVTTNMLDTIQLHSSILAYPVEGENCAGPGFQTSDGYNIADDESCGLVGPGDQPNTDPLLGPLADNGGPTRTRAPKRRSPAVDQGDGENGLDQRGLARRVDFLAIPNPPGGDGNDVGPVERQDTRDPVVKVQKVRVNRRKRSVKVRFRVKDDVSRKARLTLACKVDKQKFRKCKSPVGFKRLRPGRHRVVVRAKDAAGNRAQAGKRFRVKKPKR